MVRSLASFVLVLLLTLCWQAEGARAEERRMALIIGMSKYEQVPALPQSRQ